MPRRDNVLLVTARTPWPTASGGQQRSHLLGRAIRQVADLHLLLVDPKPRPDAADLAVMTRDFGLLADGVIESAKTPRWRRLLDPGRDEFAARRSLADAIARAAREARCDKVVFRYLPLASRSAGPVPDGLVRLADIDDVPSLRTATEVQQHHGLRRLGKRWIASRVRRWQHRALSRIDGGWVSCEEDLEIIDDRRFSVLPNIPLESLVEAVDPERCRQHADSRTVLFVGAMGYDINRHAMDWFVDRVWPLVVGKSADAKLLIAGGGLDEARRDGYSRSQGVELAGFVEDLRSAYAESALSIVPVSAGAGTKIKVLESLRNGRTVVLTRHSLRGYAHVLEDGRDLVVADEPEAMAAAIVRLIGAPEERESLARHGQQQVRLHYSFERFADIVAGVLESATARDRQQR